MDKKMSCYCYGILFLCFIQLNWAIPIERVVNGTNADIKDYPYMVSLRGPSGSHSCGASLISPDWVLTAAHCIGSVAPGYHSIQHSVTNISKTGPNIVKAQYGIVHEGYNYLYLIHDIALIKLEEPVYVSQYAVLLSQFVSTAGDSPAQLIGWGYERSGGSVQTTLQKVDLQIFSHEECKRRHNRIEVYPSNICAGVPEGGKGQCSGDSGGPLLVLGKQVGLVSWSEKPCTIAPYPGVYTQVSYYREWIRQKSRL